MSLVLLSLMNNKSIVDSFKVFLVHNGVLTMASGIIIGITSATFITKLVVNMFLPALYLSVFKWIKYVQPGIETYISSVYTYTNFNFIGFIQDFFIWVTAIISTFILLEFVRRTLLKSNAESGDPLDQTSNPYSDIAQSFPNILRSKLH
jgi:large-conductance mechanosensitive channel